jgi:NAD-dependent dihydropyrimidine dehydrogenase PreA subunit
MPTRFVIVYSSPAGSTRKVAEAVERALKALPDKELLTLDLHDANNRASTSDLMGEAADDICLFVGSPVYRDLAVTPVMEFIQKLPATKKSPGKRFAVPFATWGHVCSGIALWEMATALRDRGCFVAGAFKVPCVHSMMWRTEEPLGYGQPDEAAGEAVADFVRSLCTGLKSQAFHPLDLDTLLDQPPEWVAEMRVKLAAPRQKFPKMVDEKKCTQCGICRDECPAAAIQLSPYPGFGESCFDCHTCVRLCPEEAIDSDPPVAAICEFIRKRRVLMNEKPQAKFFMSR